MGNEMSRLPLISQLKQSICATEPGFILDRTVTFHLNQKMLTLVENDFKIRCAATGMEYFKVEGSTYSLRGKTILRDVSGRPILNVKRKLCPCPATYTVCVWNNPDKVVCNIETAFTLSKTKMSTVVRDVVTGKVHKIVLKTDWRTKRGYIYLGEPKQGGAPIARIFRPTKENDGVILGLDDYYLEIAPGVDIALMVCVCIAMDKHTGSNGLCFENRNINIC